MARSISKNRIVRTLFSKIAPIYDRMEPVLTRGRGDRWRQWAVDAAALNQPRRVLDACSGTGLMTLRLAESLGTRTHIVAIDFCPAMAAIAKHRLREVNAPRRVEVKVENVEILPYPDDFFDAVFMSFGLRFVSDIKVTLKELQRVVRPGGRVIILELSTPAGGWRKKWLRWLREHWLPFWLNLSRGLPGILLHPLHDALVHFPDAEKLKRLFLRLGYQEIRCRPLRGGYACIHTAAKPMTLLGQAASAPAAVEKTE